jgi:hypothetical protein
MPCGNGWRVHANVGAAHSGELRYLRDLARQHERQRRMSASAYPSMRVRVLLPGDGSPGRQVGVVQRVISDEDGLILLCGSAATGQLPTPHRVYRRNESTVT